MNISLAAADGILARTLDVLNNGDRSLLGALDELPAPIYVTDTDGVITLATILRASPSAGRVPALEPRPLVHRLEAIHRRWRIPSPHDKCPMADAVLTAINARTGRLRIRGRAVDGTRLNFVPFPTPLFDAPGRFIGAVNMLIDVQAARKRAAVLREQARRCHRRLAVSVDDEQTASALSAPGCRL